MLLCPNRLKPLMSPAYVVDARRNCCRSSESHDKNKMGFVELTTSVMCLTYDGPLGALEGGGSRQVIMD